MITVKNARTLDGKISDYTIPSDGEHVTIEANKKLLLLPGVIDSHLCLGDPSSENWKLEIQAAIKGGITTVIDVPCPPFSCNTKKNMAEKEQLIAKQMKTVEVPIHYFFYSQASPQNQDSIDLVKGVSMGVVLSDLDQKAVDDDAWNRIFQLAAWSNMPVVVNARNENAYGAFLSKETGKEESLLEKVLYYTEKHANSLYILNVSTEDELNLIQHARKGSMLIHAETTPQHLFPQDFKTDLLWDALNKGSIDTIGSGYNLFHDAHPSGHWYGSHVSHLELLLPLLLNASYEKRITIETVVKLTSLNIKKIFRFSKTRDAVLVDLDKERTIYQVSGDPSSAKKLKGWPEYTILNGRVFKP